MSFVKTADCESATPLDEKGKLAKVLERLGKPEAEATELEIARTAKAMGIGLKK